MFTGLNVNKLQIGRSFLTSYSGLQITHEGGSHFCALFIFRSAAINTDNQKTEENVSTKAKYIQPVSIDKPSQDLQAYFTDKSKSHQVPRDIVSENNNVISLEKRNLRDPVHTHSKTVREEVQGTYPQKIRQTEAKSLNRAIHCVGSCKHTKG